jgi:hypothetical protein
VSGIESQDRLVRLVSDTLVIDVMSVGMRARMPMHQQTLVPVIVCLMRVFRRSHGKSRD